MQGAKQAKQIICSCTWQNVVCAVPRCNTLTKVIHPKAVNICNAVIQDSKEVVSEAFDTFEVEELAIAWTGGKDSTLTLWIVRQVCQERSIKVPRCMLIDEGDTFKGIEDFVGRVQKE